MKVIHICLVSKQATPNLVPLMDSSMQVDEVILTHTRPFNEHAQWLANALKIYGKKTHY